MNTAIMKDMIEIVKIAFADCRRQECVEKLWVEIYVKESAGTETYAAERANAAVRCFNERFKKGP